MSAEACYARDMKPARPGRYAIETNAPVILEVAKAISAHLELSDVLRALITTLRPMIAFDSVSVVVLDGDYGKLHSLHIEGVERDARESVQSNKHAFRADA